MHFHFRHRERLLVFGPVPEPNKGHGRDTQDDECQDEVPERGAAAERGLEPRERFGRADGRGEGERGGGRGGEADRRHLRRAKSKGGLLNVSLNGMDEEERRK